MNNNQTEQIRAQIESDPFAKTLGARLLALGEGYSRFSLTIAPHHLNFHGIVHGGLLFSLSDVAFAAASNSRGQTAVALNVTISYLTATEVGTTLIAEAQETSLNGPIGLYAITVKEQASERLVAQCQATVYRRRHHFVTEVP